MFVTQCSFQGIQVKTVTLMSVSPLYHTHIQKRYSCSAEQQDIFVPEFHFMPVPPKILFSFPQRISSEEGLWALSPRMNHIQNYNIHPLHQVDSFFISVISCCWALILIHTQNRNRVNDCSHCFFFQFLHSTLFYNLNNSSRLLSLKLAVSRLSVLLATNFDLVELRQFFKHF